MNPLWKALNMASPSLNRCHEQQQFLEKAITDMKKNMGMRETTKSHTPEQSAWMHYIVFLVHQRSPIWNVPWRLYSGRCSQIPILLTIGGTHFVHCTVLDVQSSIADLSPLSAWIVMSSESLMKLGPTHGKLLMDDGIGDNGITGAGTKREREIKSLLL